MQNGGRKVRDTPNQKWWALISRNAIVRATTVVAEVLFDFPNRFGRRGYNFSPRRNSGCGPISDAGGQKKRNGMQ